MIHASETPQVHRLREPQRTWQPAGRLLRSNWQVLLNGAPDSVLGGLGESEDGVGGGGVVHEECGAGSQVMGFIFV